ncbi:hypothetical protein LB553_10215 [Mesorhizobium sp. CA8]|uniref:hypothetical protein n=1 Tax=unclassified Mesorhizobium TaxID=325217 RepID=UPI001CCF867C|nr:MULTISPECIES: hypothetical protein [unclassified Mesorhizobium]MBZ9761249.1 hypothetical protein [Mesorhizobium sp. CA8]MBZ9819436.1 hypothetical protein [Mesorhizobium sp. CA4]
MLLRNGPSAETNRQLFHLNLRLASIVPSSSVAIARRKHPPRPAKRRVFLCQESARMQLGEIIANLFAALLLACILGAVFLVATQPIWPDHHKGQMVVLPPADAITTGSIKATTHPHLPNAVDGNLVQPRPSRP